MLDTVVLYAAQRVRLRAKFSRPLYLSPISISISFSSFTLYPWKPALILYWVSCASNSFSRPLSLHAAWMLKRRYMIHDGHHKGSRCSISFQWVNRWVTYYEILVLDVKSNTLHPSLAGQGMWYISHELMLLPKSVLVLAMGDYCQLLSAAQALKLDGSDGY